MRAVLILKRKCRYLRLILIKDIFLLSTVHTALLDRLSFKKINTDPIGNVNFYKRLSNMMW